MSRARPLWTPPLFGWQYPIRWEQGGPAQVLDLPQGVDIWRHRDGAWIATFILRQPSADLFRKTNAEVVEHRDQLWLLIPRFEARLRSIFCGLNALR